MGRLYDLILNEDRNATEEADLRALLDRVEYSADEVSGLFDPTGNVNRLSAGYVVLDNSGLHTAKNEVIIDSLGIAMGETAGGSTYLRWIDSSGARTAYIAKATDGALTIEQEESGEDIFILNNENVGDEIFLRIGLTSSTTLGTVSVRQDPGQTDRFQVDLGVGAEGTKLTIGGEVEIYGGKDGTTTVFNGNGKDIDFVVEGDTVTDVFAVDAGLDQVLVGTSIAIKERADQQADITAYGQLWVKNTTPCQLWFTDDAGTDTQLA